MNITQNLKHSKWDSINSQIWPKKNSELDLDINQLKSMLIYQNINQKKLSPVDQKIGSVSVPLPQLKIKDNVDLVGLLELLEVLKVLIKFLKEI